MAREYQQQRQKEYLLPFTVYMQTLWCIRDYNRLREIDNAQAFQKIEAIERALDEIPKDYRRGLIDNIIDRKEYGEFAHDNTWKLWKQRFVYYAANNLGLNVGGKNNVN